VDDCVGVDVPSRRLIDKLPSRREQRTCAAYGTVADLPEED
jgi:hypothetical protein